MQIEKLNQQAMTNLLSSNPDPVFIGQLQDQFFQMLPQQAIISFGVYLLIMLGIQAYLIAKSGQSIGKKLMKIQIVNADDQQQSSLLRAFTIRSVFFILLYQFAFPLLTIVDCLFAFGKNRQTLHDKLAKTIVIKKQS